eukprot:tig00000852_g5034.t1
MLRFLALLLALIACGVKADDVFSEDLTLKELPSGLIAAFFEFEITSERPAAAPASHFDLLPKNIGQLIHDVGLEDMRLTLTRGVWNHEAWGPSPEAAPPGAELWASLPASAEEGGLDYVEGRWGRLTSALAGLFCASIQFMAPDPLAKRQSASRPVSPFFAPFGEAVPGLAEPEWAGAGVPRHVMYGSLPRETVCTENLTPWARLLPCRKAAGAGALLEALRLLSAYHLSLSLRLTASPAPEGSGAGPTWRLRQTLTAILPPTSSVRAPGPRRTAGGADAGAAWSLATLFGARGALRACPVAAHSALHIMQRRPAAAEAHGETPSEAYAAAVGPWSMPEAEGHGAGGAPRAPSEWRHPEPEAVLQARPPPPFPLPSAPPREPAQCPGESGGPVLRFDLRAGDGLNVSGRLAVAHPTAEGGSPLAVERFIAGTSLASGTLVAQVTNRRASGPPLRVLYADPLPPTVRFFSHTTEVTVLGRGGAGAGLKRQLYVPARLREEAASLVYELEVPPETTLQIATAFDKVFMHAEEFPPDPQRGLDIASAAATFRDPREPAPRAAPARPLLWCDEAPVARRQYTNGLLLSIATPDFSMPYNVISMSCTVIALWIGSSYNVLTRRPKEEERRRREAEERRQREAAEGKRGLLARLFPRFLARRPKEKSA